MRRICTIVYVCAIVTSLIRMFPTIYAIVTHIVVYEMIITSHSQVKHAMNRLDHIIMLTKIVLM